MFEAGGVAIATQALAVAGPGGRPIVAPVSFRVPERSIFAVIGPSGAGKSTLLRCLNRLIDLTPALAVTGEVQVAGRSIYAREVDVDALRREVGTLFQQPVVFPGSIAANVAFGFRAMGAAAPKKAERAERVRDALVQVGLWAEVGHRLDESAATLSLGQQQRLCLARALVLAPRALLLDEPTSALDPGATERIEELLRGLKSRLALVLVTHNLGQAERLADQVAALVPAPEGARLVACPPAAPLAELALQNGWFA
ncbi:MAG: ATP-binding cassette domain-containing protein [Thermoanaerobaculia bacterium]|nr:ATP-binding cassette domain-containing protein [Thermoanaerobaculia bacterium]